MKNYLFTLVLSLFVSFFAATNAMANGEIGFIDTVKILQQSVHGKEAIKILESAQTEGISKLEELSKKRDEAEKAKDAEKMELLTAEMQALAFSVQNEVQALQESIFATIGAELEAIVKEYRAKKGLAVIFNHADVITFDPKSDITDDIMEEFNKKKIEFAKNEEKAQ